jgi:hypothetical protein
MLLQSYACVYILLYVFFSFQQAHNLKFSVLWDVVQRRQVDVVKLQLDYTLIAWHYIPEDSKLHTCHCENLKSHKAHNLAAEMQFLMKFTLYIML